MTNQEKRKEILAKKLKEIEARFGKNTIMKMGENTALDMNRVSTGVVAIDNILGGGIPTGRIVEIYGPESSGKTTLALQILANAQKLGGTAAFIDAEHAIDTAYAKRLGVDTDELLLTQPDNGEDALEITRELASSGAVDIIIIDSVAALVPRAELDGSMGDSHVGLQARLMSQALRKLAGVTAKTDCTIIFINQIREKIGIMFGNPETTSGGRALKFFSSIRIEVRKSTAIKDGIEMVGAETNVKIVKNKTAVPFKSVKVDIMFGKGFDKERSLINLATQKGIIEKNGSWFSYKNERIGQGKSNVKEFLMENPDIFEDIEKRCIENVSTDNARDTEEPSERDAPPPVPTDSKKAI